SENRWMPTIGLSATGNIGLAYNVSSSSTNPEIRYTGRKECDPLGMMTEPETQLVDGTANNNTNRWGDYNAMGVDPSDGETFWFTAQYSPATQARTRIGAFKIDQCSPTVQFNSAAYNPNESDADVVEGCLDYYVVDIPIKIGSDPSQPADIVVNVTGGSATQGVDYAIFNTTGTLDDPTLSFTVQVRVYNDNYVEGTETITLDYSLNPNGGNAVAGTTNQTVTITINDDDIAPAAMSSLVTILTEDFEGTGGAMPTGWSTVNNGTPADDAFQVGNNAAAASGAYSIPVSNTTDFAWINDDACNCDQNDVDIFFPSIDLTGYLSATLIFDTYFESNTYMGDTELAELRVSIGGGPATTVGSLTASAIDGSWITQNFDISAYVGNSNVVFSVNYSDATGWLYGCTIDDVLLTGGGPINVQQAVNAGSAMTANLGPNSTVHFYDAASQDVMITLDNSSSFDFGCVTVQVDRAGTGVAQFSSTNTSNYLADKTFTVTPTNNSGSATYDVTLYYKEAEVAGWESATGNARSVAEVIKVAGANPISVVTPANYGTFNIDNVVGTIGAFNSDVTFTATFGNGFSGFGLGVYAPGIPGAPTAGFSPSTSTECEGGCITFTDASMSTDPGGITSWAWDFGDGNSSSSPSPTNCYATAGTYVVTLVVTDAVASDNQTSVVTIGAASTNSIAANLCPGQAVSVGSSTYTTAGSYTDVLTNAAGCDSTITTTVVELAATSFTQSTTFCDGGNIVVGSSTYTTSGTYTDVLTNGAGCDSTVTTTVTVNSNPTPTIDNASALDTLCENGNPVTILSTPVGGTFSGTGVAGNSFNPLTAGPGSHIVTYSYSDGSGCIGQTQITVIVVDCTIGIKEEALEGVNLFPSPNNGQFVINGLVAGTTYKIFDEQGKLILSEAVGSASENVNLKNVADGLYVLRATKNGKEGCIKFTVTKQ
ncbi:MAG: PKD repeat protein, partial [Parvicellaceae bacterium]